MKNQQIINRVCDHLMRQGRRCDTETGPKIWHGDLRDPLGVLIDVGGLNPEYSNYHAGATWTMVRMRQAGIDPAESLDLISDLVRIHDDVPVQDWKLELRRCCRRHELMIPESIGDTAYLDFERLLGDLRKLIVDAESNPFLPIAPELSRIYREHADRCFVAGS